MGELDQDVVNLAKSVREREGNAAVQGQSGEFGNYQYTPDTWREVSRKYLGYDVPLERASLQQQNEATYKRFKEWKDKGYNPGQIASMHNAGEGEPDAYLGSFSDGSPSAGVNKYGVKFDVPGYAKDVAMKYQALKTGAPQAPTVPGAPVAHAATQTPQPEAPKKDFLQKAGDVVNAIFPGKQVGEAIGTLGGYLLANKDEKQFYDTSAPSPLQVAGDVAQGALTVGAGLPAKTYSAFGQTFKPVAAAGSALGRIGQGAALGAGIGATGAIAKGDQVPEVLKDAATGGLVGGAIGGMGEIVSAATKNLPERIVRSFVPGTNKATAEYAVSKGLKTPMKMLEDSKKEISTLGSQLGSALKKPEISDITIPGEDLYERVVQQYPEAGLTPDDLYDNLKRLVPLKRTLVEKLEREGLTLQELHSLNSALGNSTFKTVFDDPAVKAGKEVGSSFYHAAKDAITSVAPETEPVFSTLTKEYQLKSALEKAIRRGEKAKALNLKDILFMVGGSFGAGPTGIVGGYAASRALNSPAVNMQFGNAVNAVSSGGLKPLVPLVQRQIENLRQN